MTRRDQILRAWIERPSPRHNWTSCVSYRRKTHKKTTNSRHRKAALEFSSLHIAEILFPTTTEQTTHHHQPDLF